MPERNPFLLEEPAVISFSGGRTSAYLLHRTLEAYGGELPEGVRVIFCNTGKERPETLDFIERCSQRWSVPVTWLEYWPGENPSGKSRHWFREVNYATAARQGEPFTTLIEARKVPPNVRMRFCTGQLKIHTTNRYVRHELGWTEYRNAIGLRHDEPRRVAKILAPQQTTRTVETLFGQEEETVGRYKEELSGEEPCCPLHRAKVTLDEIMAFWQQERGGLALNDWLALPKAERPGWDLELRPDEGNCDCCFLKGAGKLLEIMRERPDLAAWWIEQEEKQLGKSSHTFRNDRPPYRILLEMAQQPGLDFSCFPSDPTLPCHCTD
ncbi:MAG: phosphoadenosine phosphosulfate reductase family protein [Patescibacteria group bacterium]|nr:phosphoadenosine phosphosulfate reductase family protein [Patescibacteria group bacterium]